MVADREPSIQIQQQHVAIYSVYTIHTHQHRALL